MLAGLGLRFFSRVRYRSKAADGDQEANMYIAIIYNFFAARFVAGFAMGAIK